MQKLRETDKKLHGRDGYLVSELIRQLVQIRFGELTSEEAKGKRHRKIWYDRESPAVHGRNIAAGSVKTYKPQSDVD